jgi:hypothetical protein
MSTTRRTVNTTVTHVSHVASPMGKARENGPHLIDLREFVAACEGLPHDVLVRIDKGYLSESGRKDLTFTVNYTHPPEDVHT